MKTIVAILGLFISLPIWFYLFYQVLVKIEATELMFFLYWVYVPITLLVGVLTRLIEE